MKLNRVRQNAFARLREYEHNDPKRELLCICREFACAGDAGCKLENELHFEEEIRVFKASNIQETFLYL